MTSKRLTDYLSYADAQTHFSKDRLWALLDGDRRRLNIGHECLDRHPGARMAVRIAFADGREESFTFGELTDWSNRFANYLGRFGLAKGDRVAIMLDPSLPFYFALFGAMKAGFVAVPLFTLFGPDGLALRIDDCAPRILLAPPDKAGLAAGRDDLTVIPVDAVFLDAVARESNSFTPDTAADDMAMYQYTSGTTRELPEAVKHRHRAVVTVIIAALYATGVRPGDLFMCPSSPAWGHGLWHGTLAPLALGVTIASYSGPFDPARLLGALEDFRITNISAAATHYRMMKNCGAAAGHEFTIEKASFTGEPIDSATAEWAEALFGTPVCSIYGTTETGIILAGYPGAPDFDRRPGSLGKPVPTIELAIHDTDGKPCPPGTIGEIMLCRGETWFPTKDRGHTDSDGYYYHDGRADDVIISAGWTMSAVEIEDILLKHADVTEAAAIGVPDETRGQVVKAFIVSARPGDEAFARELRTFSQQRLSRHEYPRRITFTDQLPKTDVGKVSRKKLREMERAGQFEETP